MVSLFGGMYKDNAYIPLFIVFFSRVAYTSQIAEGNMSIIFPQIDLETVHGVLIDIDNTLYPYAAVHDLSLKVCYKYFMGCLAESAPALTFEEFSEKYTQERQVVVDRLEHQGSCRSRFLVFQAILESYNAKLAYDKACTLEDLYWTTFIPEMRVDRKAVGFLIFCREKGLPVCAVSDMQAHIQVRKLRQLGLHHLIDFLVTSEEVGIEKPDKKMFETALRKLGLGAHQVIMIGDSHSKDIKGAESLKIRTYEVKTV